MIDEGDCGAIGGMKIGRINTELCFLETISFPFQKFSAFFLCSEAVED
jgi:hypothetical protein